MSRSRQKLADVVPKLRQVYAYFWPDIRPHRTLIAGSMAALLCGVVVRLLEPWPIKVFLDAVVPIGRAQYDGGPFADWSAYHLLAMVAASLVVIALGRATADYISRVGFFIVGNRVVIRIRDRVYRHLQELSVAFHARARTGDLIIRVTRDVSLLRDVTATAMLPLIASSMVLIGMIAVMFWLRWQLTLLALATLPLFWLTTVRLGRRIRETARRQRQREGAMASTAAEALGAIHIIKAMGLEDRFARSFSQRNQASQKEDLKASRLSVRLGRVIDVLLAGSSALVLWFGGQLVLKGQMTAGDIIVFLTYLKRSFKPAQEFAKYVARLAKATAAGERIIDLLEQAPEISDLPDAVMAPKFDGHLRMEGVTFEFTDGNPVLRDVSLEVAAGEMVAIIGPSGGGKSTLLGHVLRLYDPQSGSITIDGHRIGSLTRKSLRGQISSVMQDPLLLAASVFENIACGAEHADRAQVIAAAQLANAHPFIEQIPGGYDAAIGERGATLSRGQRQRIAIARAAVRRAPILLLDEPTTGLDEENEQLVVDALVRLAQGKSTLLVTHSLDLASRADRIVFLDAGRVVEQGTLESLLQRNGRSAHWFRQRQARTRRAVRAYPESA